MSVGKPVETPQLGNGYDIMSSCQKTKINDLSVSIGIKCGQNYDPPTPAGFFDHDYCYKSAVIQFYMTLGCHKLHMLPKNFSSTLNQTSSAHSMSYEQHDLKFHGHGPGQHHSHIFYNPLKEITYHFQRRKIVAWSKIST